MVKVNSLFNVTCNSSAGGGGGDAGKNFENIVQTLSAPTTNIVHNLGATKEVKNLVVKNSAGYKVPFSTWRNIDANTTEITTAGPDIANAQICLTYENL